MTVSGSRMASVQYTKGWLEFISSFCVLFSLGENLFPAKTAAKLSQRNLNQLMIRWNLLCVDPSCPYACYRNICKQLYCRVQCLRVDIILSYHQQCHSHILICDFSYMSFPVPPPPLTILLRPSWWHFIIILVVVVVVARRQTQVNA